MTTNERRLIALLVRFQNAVVVMQEACDESAERDAAFDSGEFSGRYWTDESERRLNPIARRFGFATADLAFDVARKMRCALWPSRSYFTGRMPLPLGGDPALWF